MTVFDHNEFREHEQVSFFSDKPSGLKAIVAIHHRVDGRAGGGIRMRDYSGEHEALGDVLRLSRAMTYKMAMAGARIGGAKTVVLADPARDKTTAKLEALGRIVESFGGGYVAGEDVGITPEDIPVIKQHTSHVIGGPDDTTSPMTSLGVYQGMRAAVQERLGRDNLKGLRVAIQGAGNVAWHLMFYLQEAGAEITIADIDPAAVERAVAAYAVRVVAAEDILSQAVDIFSPCALGAVLNQESIPRLQADIVCGCANNQLAEAEDDARLHNRGILYVPDYVVNAGGVIVGTGILAGDSRDEIQQRVEGIYDTCRRVISKAIAEDTGTEAAANSLAEAIIRHARV